jgi:hypothetical protein
MALAEESRAVARCGRMSCQAGAPPAETARDLLAGGADGAPSVSAFSPGRLCPRPTLRGTRPRTGSVSRIFHNGGIETFKLGVGEFVPHQRCTARSEIGEVRRGGCSLG